MVPTLKPHPQGSAHQNINCWHNTRKRILTTFPAAICMSRSSPSFLARQVTEVTGDRALVAGTNTLCGAIATLWRGIQKLIKGARCSIVEALEAATLHPAQVLETINVLLDRNRIQGPDQTDLRQIFWERTGDEYWVE